MPEELLASHPTPDGDRGDEAGRLAAFEALTTGDFFTFTDGGEGQEEYVWRYVDAVLNAYLAATPDGPASPVLGDEEPCEHCDGEGHLRIQSTTDPLAVSYPECPRCSGTGLAKNYPPTDAPRPLQPRERCPKCGVKLLRAGGAGEIYDAEHRGEQKGLEGYQAARLREEENLDRAKAAEAKLLGDEERERLAYIARDLEAHFDADPDGSSGLAKDIKFLRELAQGEERDG